MEYRIEEIAQSINGQIVGHKEFIVSHAFIDSRNVIPSERSIFFAIKGKRNNGHQYIKDLISRGVRSFVIEEMTDVCRKNTNCNFILVSNVLAAFQDFATWHRNKFNIPVLGITGSNGKTIVKEWLYHLLDSKLKIVRNPKSYNSQVGVPLSILLMDQMHEIGLFEAGISEPGEMKNLEKMIRPQTGIFTNIGHAHQENFTDFDQKVKEKMSLFENCREIIYCSDYEQIEKHILPFATKRGIKLFSWSKTNSADLRIDKINIRNKQTEILTTFQNREVEISIPFSDDASIENALHCLAFLLSNGFFDNEIQKKFKSLPGVGMRLELMNGINQCTLINDSYNSDLNSIRIALDVLKRQNQHRKKCLILSDVLQSGEKDNDLYQKLEQLVSHAGIHKIIGIGQKISNYYPKSKIKSIFFQNTADFLKSNELKQFNNEAILIKGAREFKFEEISKALQQKTHRTVLEISLEALENNLNYFKSLLKPGTGIMVMVKAFSYGSGSFEIASFLEHQRVSYLGVAFADEGVALRKAGIKLPIVVMNPEEGSFENILKYGLEPEIYSFRALEKFGQQIKNSRKKQCFIHLKIDTGMKRLGFLPGEIDKLIDCLQDNPQLVPKSVFSHLVASEDNFHDEFSNKQISLFEEISLKIQNKYKHKIIRHILNSSGIERFTNAQFEMVRLGIGLYGISGKKNISLEHTSTLKSHITQIKWIESHETIGYGRKGTVNRDSKIAIVPIGYADGLNRKLGNRLGRVFIKGQYAPIVGNICMDMCMVDITDIEADEGEEVIFFGKEIPVSELAEKTGTIPYEILTGVSQRVKRIYIH